MGIAKRLSSDIHSHSFPMFTTSTGRAFYHPIEPSKVTKTTGMAPARTERDGFDVSIEEVPVTVQRRPFIPRRGDEMLKDPGMS